MSDDEVDNLLEWVAFGIGRRPAPRVDDATLRKAIRSAFLTALDGQLYDAVRSGALALDEVQWSRVAIHHEMVMLHVLQVDRQLLRVTQEFERQQIPYRLLKGVALAHSIYPDPSCRSYGDADILVMPERIPSAIHAVESIGGRRLLPEPRPGYDVRFAKDIPLILDGVAIDLHRTLVGGPYGFDLPIEQIFSRRRDVTIGSRVMPSLDPVDHFLHAAITAGAGDVPPRLVTLADMIRLRQDPAFSTEMFFDRAPRWGQGIPIAYAVRLVGSMLEPSGRRVLSEWATTVRPTARQRLVHTAYLSRHRGVWRSAAAVAGIPWRDKAEFVAAHLFPRHAYLRRRGYGRWTPLARTIRSVRTDMSRATRRPRT